MKTFIFGLIFSLTMIVAMGVMGVEIFENSMRNLDLIEGCAWVVLACLIGNLIVALVRLWKEKHP